MGRKNKQLNLDVEDIEALTFNAMRESGLLPPMTTEDVEQLEAELDAVELPFGPSDPMVLLESLEKPRGAVIQMKASETDAARNLACAAREGGDVSPEIKERMAKDKAQHEQNRIKE